MCPQLVKEGRNKLLVVDDRGRYSLLIRQCKIPEITKSKGKRWTRPKQATQDPRSDLRLAGWTSQYKFLTSSGPSGGVIGHVGWA